MSWTTKFNGRPVMVLPQWGGDLNESHIASAHWLDTTGPDDEHPDLNAEELADLAYQEFDKMLEEFRKHKRIVEKYIMTGEK